MKDNYGKIVSIVSKEGIYVQSKKEYCILNNLGKLGPTKKMQEIAKYKELGVAMIDLNGRIAFFNINDKRFKV